MKQLAMIIWLLIAFVLGIAGAASWPLVAGLLLMPMFFIGKPWYSSFLKTSDEQ